MSSSSIAKTLRDIGSKLSAARAELRHDDHRDSASRFAREALSLDLDAWQEGVLDSSGKRDLLNCSRQAGKSTTAAVLALHEAIYRPGSLTLLVSPSQRQSSELFRKVTDLRHSLLYPLDLTEDNRLSMAVAGGGRVVSLPGSESTIRGYSGVTLLVEDEAARVPDDLYFAVRPMLSVNNGRLVLMSTPWGKRGHFFEAFTGDGAWDRIEIPATQVPRISPEFLEEEKASMPYMFYRQEYLCEFAETIDAVFQYDDIMAAGVEDFEPFLEEVSGEW